MFYYKSEGSKEEPEIKKKIINYSHAFHQIKVEMVYNVYSEFNGGCDMNILFFLTPKSDVAYVYNDETLRQVLEKIEYHKYTAIPLLNRNGRYVGTVTEGDLLRVIKERYMLNLKEAEDCMISRVPLRWKYKSVSIDCDMEDLVEVAMNQNYVPVVDDADNFIGIIRRSDIIKYCYNKSKAEERLAAK